MSAGALSDLLTATGQRSQAGASEADAPSTSGASSPALDIEAVRGVRAAALTSVRMPPGIVNMLVDLRTYMQETLEPPAYVSDRRMVKAVELLQVRHCNQDEAFRLVLKRTKKPM